MAAKAGWSHSLTDFADQASEDITRKARAIAMAMLSEVVTRSPVGNPDLWEANKEQLEETGIPIQNIEVAKICTKCNNTLFFSSRHDNGRTGRFGIGITII